MKSNSVNVDGVVLVQVEGRKEGIPMLVADLNAGKKLVIVSEDVLDYLIDLLPKAQFRHIKDIFVDKVNQTQTMDEFLTLLTQELNFHESVNMIRWYYRKDDVSREVAVVSDRPGYLD